MKNLTIIPVLACFMLAATVSCKKSSSNNTTTPTSTGGPAISFGNVDGGFVSLKTRTTTVAAGVPFSITAESGVATFFASTGNSSSFIDGGTVSVNGTALDKQSNNSYIKTATVGSTPADLSFGTNSSNWSIGGAGSVTGFTYNDNATFPEFSGSMPDSVVRSAGVTISLGSVSNADSVILFIAAGSKTVMRTVAGSASSVTLSSSDLSGFSAVSDKTAVLEVIPYRFSVSTQGGKQYAFVKELAVVTNINIQ